MARNRAMDREWRVGHKLGRTIYARRTPATDSDVDGFIGVMDTRKLAEEAVEAHNRSLWDRQLKEAK